MAGSITTSIKFSPNGQENIVRITRIVESIQPKFPGMEGEVKITATTHYDFQVTDFVIDKLPKSCHACPCGYSCNGIKSCGRNVPMKDEDSQRRPDTCKLIDIDSYLERLNG